MRLAQRKYAAFPLRMRSLRTDLPAQFTGRFRFSRNRFLAVELATSIKNVSLDSV